MDATPPRPERTADRPSDAVNCDLSLSACLELQEAGIGAPTAKCCAFWQGLGALRPRSQSRGRYRCRGVASMSADPETTNKIAVEERAPAKPAPADTCSANPLRKAALIVVAVTILLFALSIVMERFTPSSSQAVVQAYVIRMAPEVAGRVIGVDVADNARVEV